MARADGLCKQERRLCSAENAQGFATRMSTTLRRFATGRTACLCGSAWSASLNCLGAFGLRLAPTKYTTLCSYPSAPMILPHLGVKQIGHNLVDAGQNPVPVSSNFVSILVGIVGLTPAKLGRIRPNLAGFGPDLAQVGPISVEMHKQIKQCWPTYGQT